MEASDISDLVQNVRPDVVTDVITAYLPPGSPEELWDTKGLSDALLAEFGLKADVEQWLKDDQSLDDMGLRRKVIEMLESDYAEKRERAGAQVIQHFEKAVMLQTLDRLWREHLASMDYLRQGINLRAYAQKDPKQEYKREAFALFNDLLARLKHEVIATLSKVRVQAESDVEAVEAQRRAQAEALRQRGQASHADAASALGPDAEPAPDAAQPGQGPRRMQAGPGPAPVPQPSRAPVLRSGPPARGAVDPLPRRTH